MSAFKGTPGPWTFTDGDTKEPIGPKVVFLDDDGACGDPECCGAPYYWIAIKPEDGRLIAAAPELLEVAQRSADALRSAGIEPRATSDNPLEWLLHQTEAAIAKATGEQP